MEGIPVQPFHEDPESGPVPLEDLDQCASAIAECEHTTGIRVEMEFQFDDRSQTSVALAEICNPARQVDRCASGEIKHNSLRPAEAQSSAWQDSLLQLQSGYFPEEGLSRVKSPQGH